MSIYQRNLRRLGLILIAVSILDLVLELAFYRYLQSTMESFTRQLQSPLGICVKDGLGLVVGVFALILFSHKEYEHWIVVILVLLLIAAFPAIIISTEGEVSSRVDGLINPTMILMAMVVYTALQLQRSERNWERIRSSQPSTLDLQLNDVRQWFNPIKIGPKLDMNQEIASVVNRFLETSKEALPLEITVSCPGTVSEPMQATMQEVFQMYYEDEERHINSYLERRYIRVMALVIISILAATIWVNFSPSNAEGITWTILSNFAGFSLWQIGNTYFERSEGYGELLRAMIAKQAKIHFWGE